MKESYRTLGRTGLQVSSLALGTVEIGLLNYGFSAPEYVGRPAEQDAIRLVHAALEASACPSAGGSAASEAGQHVVASI